MKRNKLSSQKKCNKTTKVKNKTSTQSQAYVNTNQVRNFGTYNLPFIHSITNPEISNTITTNICPLGTRKENSMNTETINFPSVVVNTDLIKKQLKFFADIVKNIHSIVSPSHTGGKPYDLNDVLKSSLIRLAIEEETKIIHDIYHRYNRDQQFKRDVGSMRQGLSDATLDKLTFGSGKSTEPDIAETIELDNTPEGIAKLKKSIESGLKNEVDVGEPHCHIDHKVLNAKLRQNVIGKNVVSRHTLKNKPKISKSKINKILKNATPIDIKLPTKTDELKAKRLLKDAIRIDF